MAETSSNPHQEAAGVDSPSFGERLRRLASALADRGLNSLALNPGPSLTYLTGLHFHLMERPVVAFFGANTPVVFVLPELEKAKVDRLPFPAQVFLFGEDPNDWPATFHQAAQAAGIDNQAVGVEPTGLRFLELRLLEGAAPRARFVSAEHSLAALRMYKDSAEIAALRKAVDIAQQALLATLPQVRAGVTERQIAAELTIQLLRAGSDTEFPFAPIVSGGPNSANPHATPGDRPLQHGDLLVIDWGATYHGYLSDLTRTFAIGTTGEEFVYIAKVVLQANTAGREAARPGVQAGQVDAAARAVIEQAGYGAYFTHRTGHGIGLEAHEGPYMRSGNELILEPGMTFTIEPGIYLPGRGGVRIEDNVVVTQHGAESLSDLPRELQIIGR
jgi:Xaa-Pro dipeptidase